MKKGFINGRKMPNEVGHILGVIPARGRSKSVPRKNIRSLRGKPLLAHTIESALAAETLDRVIVSTDDDKIAGVARKYGAEVPFLRPAELATDTVSLEPVLLHALNYLEDKENYPVDIIVLLQPTSPLRHADIIDQAVNKLLSTGADSVLTVCRKKDFHGWMGKLNGDRFEPTFKERPRRQDTEEYSENGAVYATRKATLIKEKNRLGGEVRAIVMNERDSCEIDDEWDFWLVKKILEVFHEKDKGWE